MYYIGVDIGSTNSKLALIDENEKIIETFVISTGFSSKNSSEKLLNYINEKGYDLTNIKIVATGYGRVSVEGAIKTVTEITCHAKGSCKIFDNNNLIVIDIGGQDTKVINVEDGMVKDFVMNDKCSAGTGRFLDIMSKTMDCDIKSLIDFARTGSGVTISSLCTVFAESEVISLIGKSEKKENIANAIVKSIVTKVASQVGKIQLNEKLVCLTGGLCDMSLITDMLSDLLKVKVVSNSYGRFAGAIGAAIVAKELK